MSQIQSKRLYSDERRIVKTMGKWAERKPKRTKQINELRIINTTIVVLHAAHHVKKRINVTSCKLLNGGDIPISPVT